LLFVQRALNACGRSQITIKVAYCDKYWEVPRRRAGRPLGH
jgi:hypothetical protein